MKYCQKCKVMLQDEVEVCPICGTTQLPAEEYEAKTQKKKKNLKTAIIVIAAVIAAVLIAYAVIMLGGKATKSTGLDEKYTASVTDNEILAQFAAYIVVVMPEVWEESDEEIADAITYYNENDYPSVASGFEQMKALKPIVGEIESVTFDNVVSSEDGKYKIVGDLVCANGRVKYGLGLSSSGYVDTLTLELKDETVLQKARDFLVRYLPEDITFLK